MSNEGWKRRSLIAVLLALLLFPVGSCNSAETTAPLQIAPVPLGRLVLAPSALDFGYSAPELILTIKNEGTGPLDWSAQSSGLVSIVPLAGSLAAHSQTKVRVIASRGTLSAGEHNGSLQVTSNGGNQSVLIHVAKLSVPPQVPPKTVNVRDFGALGDGQHDDTPAFNAALSALGSAGGVLQVPAGTYLVTPKSGLPDRALDFSNRFGITVSGAGLENSTIRMAGGTHSGGDTHLVFSRESSWITFQDLTLDGNRQNAIFADEQNHCVEIWSSVQIRFSRVRFQNCRGDGIRLVGLPEFSSDPWTELVTVEQSVFLDNGRSGIAVQRGVRNLRIVNSVFERISDQSIDIEPTGNGSPTDIEISDNLIRHSSQTYAVAIGGIGGDDLAQRLEFIRNRVENGAVLVYKADGVLLQGNSILGDGTNSPLRVSHTVMNLQVVDNEIFGYSGGEDGVVQVVALNDGYPSNVTLRENVIHASEGNSGIFVRDALGGVEILSNEVTGAGAANGILISSILQQGVARDRFSLIGNRITNFDNGIQLSTRNDGFSNVTIESNFVDHSLSSSGGIIGILFVNTGPYEAFGIVLSNVFGTGVSIPIAVH